MEGQARLEPVCRKIDKDEEGQWRLRWWRNWGSSFPREIFLKGLGLAWVLANVPGSFVLQLN